MAVEKRKRIEIIRRVIRAYKKHPELEGESAVTIAERLVDDVSISNVIAPNSHTGIRNTMEREVRVIRLRKRRAI